MKILPNIIDFLNYFDSFIFLHVRCWTCTETVEYWNRTKVNVYLIWFYQTFFSICYVLSVLPNFLQNPSLYQCYVLQYFSRISRKLIPSGTLDWCYSEKMNDLFVYCFGKCDFQKENILRILLDCCMILVAFMLDLSKFIVLYFVTSLNHVEYWHDTL